MKYVESHLVDDESFRLPRLIDCWRYVMDRGYYLRGLRNNNLYSVRGNGTMTGWAPAPMAIADARSVACLQWYLFPKVLSEYAVSVGEVQFRYNGEDVRIEVVEADNGGLF